jgi:DNA-binding phage protein
MMAFAEELWQRDPIDQASLVATLDAIDAWLQNAQETRTDERIGELQGIIERIKQIRPPFS